jgi:hypothetical protein
MWVNLKIMMCMEYAKTHWQDAVTAKAIGQPSAHNRRVNQKPYQKTRQAD